MYLITLLKLKIMNIYLTFSIKFLDLKVTIVIINCNMEFY